MNARQASRLAWPLWVVLALAWIVPRLAVPLTPEQWRMDPPMWHLGFLAYGAIGALIVTRRPGNVVGWLFLAAGAFDIASATVRAFAIAGANGNWTDFADIAAWLQAWIWAPSMAALVLLVWIFPHQTLPPGRGRWGAYVTLLALGLLLLPTPVLLWPHRGPRLLTEATLPGAAGVVPPVAFSLLAAALAAGVVALVFRLRRAVGVERQQLKWFVYAGVVMVTVMLVDMLVLDRIGFADGPAREALNATAFMLVPISTAVALLRYRLYDIDRIINRTVVYGALTLVLASAYAAVVTLTRLLTEPVVGDSTLAVAASTLVVAALFAPARARVQRLVDRRFNRARFDAAATIHTFAGRLRDEVDLSTLRRDVLEVTQSTMQPTAVRLWLREP